MARKLSAVVAAVWSALEILRRHLSAWFGIDPAPRFEDSFNLQPLVEGAAAVSGRERVFSGAAGLGWSVRTPEFRYVMDAAPDKGGDGWLFIKPDDMNDILNVANQYPDVASRLQSEVAGHFGLERGAIPAE